MTTFQTWNLRRIVARACAPPAALVILLAGWPPSLQACGDKIIDISRGVRFQRACVIRPAAILIAPQPGSGALDRLGVELTRVGHRVQFARSPEALRQLLESKDFDLVVAPVAAADELAGQLGSARSSPLLVPVVTGATPAELSSVRGVHGFALSLAEDGRKQLLTIDEAMKTRWAADAAGRSAANRGR